MELCGQKHGPAALFPGKETRYALYRRWGRVWKILPPSGFEPQTVQPTVCLYTERAIAAHRTIFAVVK